MSKILFTEAADPNRYEDIPRNMLEKYKQNEIKWARQDDERKDQWSNPPSDPSLFVPIGMGATHAMGLSYDCANDFKRIQTTRERHAFAFYWKQRLMRCRHRKQYDNLMEEFTMVIKHDPETFKVSARALFEDKELLEYRNSLPEDRSETDESGLKKTPLDRPRPACVMKPTPFCTDTGPGTTEVDVVQLLLLNHRHPKESKRTWKIWTSISCDSYTFVAGYQHPHMDLHLVAYYVDKNRVCVQLFDHKNKQNVRKWYVEAEPRRILTCTMTPDGKHIAICDEVTVFVWNINGDDHMRSFTLESKEVYVHTVTMTNAHILLGTTYGQIYRLDLQTCKLLAYDELPNTVVIIQMAATRSKVLVQTIHGLVLIKAHTMLDIQTFRPLSCALLGTQIVSFGKYGTTVTFSTEVRKFKTVLKQPEDKANREIEMTPWYQGLWLAQDGSEMGMLYGDGYVRRVGL